MNNYNIPRTKVTRTAAQQLRVKLEKVPGYESLCIKEETWAFRHNASKKLDPTLYNIYVGMGEYTRIFSDPSLTLACHACEQWIADGCRPLVEELHEKVKAITSMGEAAP